MNETIIFDFQCTNRIISTESFPIKNGVYLPDMSTDVIQHFQHIDAACGGYPSHMLERLGDAFWDKCLRRSRDFLFRKAQEKMNEAGADISPEASPRLIADILRNADGVNDDTILDIWANLLAKAAYGDDKTIRPIYFDIISKLSPKDALTISVIGSPEMEGAKKQDNEKNLGENKPSHHHVYFNVERLFKHHNLEGDDLEFCFDALERLGLIKRYDRPSPYYLTLLGKGFYQAVCAPLKSQSDQT